MTVCPFCHSNHNVKTKQHGFSENIYRCTSCQKNFNAKGTGSKVLTATAMVVGIFAGVDSVADTHHLFDNG